MSDDLAAAMFPAEWAAVEGATGRKARNRRRALRRRADHEAAMAPLRAAGRSCASCRNFEKGPPGIGGRICSADSDFQGYARAVATGLCPKWRDR